MAVHTLVETNGTIANALIPVLQRHNETIRLVFRNPKSVAGAQTVAADALQMASTYMRGSDKVFVVPEWLLKAIGWFSPFMREAYEMNYQDEFAFRFDSSRSERTFHFRPTSYEDGIRATADWFLSQSAR